jgi:hypothetical protein
VFIWVIQDKSYVIAIFADIPDDEIRPIIKEAESFDIRKIKYKNRWILSCQGDEEKFWSKVTKAKKKEKNKQEILQASPIGSLMSKSKEMPNQSVAPSEQPLGKNLTSQKKESNMVSPSLKKKNEEKNIKKNEESEESKKEDLDQSMDAKKKLDEELEDSKSEDDVRKDIGSEIEKVKKEEEKKKIDEEMLKKCAAKKKILNKLE